MPPTFLLFTNRVDTFQEDLLKSFSHKMEKIRGAFPRLYFLSDDEVLDVLLTSDDPRKLLPIVRKCFPGVQSIKFSLPGEGAKPNTALDAALKGAGEINFCFVVGFFFLQVKRMYQCGCLPWSLSSNFN